MLLLLSLLLVLILSPFLTTCATLRGAVRRPRSRLGFFESRPDFRLCAFPFCGGSFLRPIDGSWMTCPGAVEGPTAECYVASMRYPGGQPQESNATALTSILYGRIVPGNYPDIPEAILNDFVVRQEWAVAALMARPIALDYTIRRDYRKCAAPLCGGYWLTAQATAQTLCSDGTVSAADGCYVANLNLTALDPTPPDEIIIVDGSTVRGYYVDNPIYATTSWPDMTDLYVLEVSNGATATATSP
jgi:hypothetical protein